MDNKIFKLQKFLKNNGFNKQASFLVWLLGACKSENELVRLDPDSSSGLEDANSEAITIDSLPPCVQTIRWLPEPEDPRWSSQNGVPLSEFKILGNEGLSYGFTNEEIQSGQGAKGGPNTIYITFSGDSNSEVEDGHVACVWSYICDLDGYWSSNYNVWDWVREDDDGNEIYGMDRVYRYYDEAPLIRVFITFPLHKIGEEYFVKLPVGRGGAITHHGIDDDCVQAYLQAIGEEISEDAE